MKNNKVIRKSKNNRPCVGYCRAMAIQRFSENPKNTAEYNTYQKVYLSYWKSLFVKVLKFNSQ